MTRSKPVAAALLITRITVVLLALAVAAWAVRTAHRNANPPPAPAPEVVATPEEAPPPVEQPAAPTEVGAESHPAPPPTVGPIRRPVLFPTSKSMIPPEYLVRPAPHTGQQDH